MEKAVKKWNVAGRKPTLVTTLRSTLGVLVSIHNTHSKSVPSENDSKSIVSSSFSISCGATAGATAPLQWRVRRLHSRHPIAFELVTTMTYHYIPEVQKQLALRMSLRGIKERDIMRATEDNSMGRT